MKPAAYVLTALIAHAPLSAYAHDTDASACKNVADDAARLACYDAAYSRSVDATVSSSENMPADRIDKDENQESEVATGFGAEQVPLPSTDYLEARLVGDFKGWNGRTVFRLDNGQVWRQTRNYIPNYKPREPIPQVKVTISKGAFGSYNLQVEGVKRIVQVKRVK